jgi:hypothetical protein
MEEPVFEIGDVVVLRSNDKYKMSVVKIHEYGSICKPGEVQVVWLLKNGKRSYDVFPCASLKKYEEKG